MAEPFWKDGLVFECARCSACCRGEPGFVFLSKDDLRGLMDHLGLDFKPFFTKYCRTIPFGDGTAVSLRETESFDCIFWETGGCAVYGARPVQCRTYPFWTGIADSPEDWAREARHCPGIGRGSVRGRADIEEALWAYRRNTPILLPAGARPETLDDRAILGG